MLRNEDIKIAGSLTRLKRDKDWTIIKGWFEECIIDLCKHDDTHAKCEVDVYRGQGMRSMLREIINRIENSDNTRERLELSEIQKSR